MKNLNILGIWLNCVINLCYVRCTDAWLKFCERFDVRHLTITAPGWTTALDAAIIDSSFSFSCLLSSTSSASWHSVCCTSWTTAGHLQRQITFYCILCFYAAVLLLLSYTLLIFICFDCLLPLHLCSFSKEQPAHLIYIKQENMLALTCGCLSSAKYLRCWQ